MIALPDETNNEAAINPSRDIQCAQCMGLIPIFCLPPPV